ncbi:TNFRSF11B [Branchiostoma lanceolatum]|uniref:TNFRSF11B protein n=1 Tax=Branchiostoma lanceolatum TaxID=7740 RepID=A0A8J9ZAF1_BRALA|nr:TNFRSF11B [Branchiostoma lanceolatum]
MTERLLLLLLFIMPSHLSKLDQCDLCPPGTYFVKKCKNGFPHTTKCEPCPNGTYTEYHNRLKNCLRHTHCAGRNMVEHPGNATRRTLCICEEGYHMAFEFFKICLRNAECPPGTGVTEQGNGCKRCPRGFYSDKHSFKYSCRPWTNCAANGLAVIERGTRKSDVTCGPLNLTTVGLTNFANAKDLDVTEAISQPDISEDEHSLQTHEIIVMSLLSFLTTYSLVLSAFALWRRCKKCKNGQPRDRLERPDPEMDYANGCSTLPVQESYMGEIIFRQTAPVSCAPSLASLDVLPDVSTYLFVRHF